MINNFVEGHEGEICLKCSNKDSSVNLNFKFKQYLRCHNRLKEKTSAEIDEYGKSNIEDLGVLRWKYDSNIRKIAYASKTWTTFISDSFDAFFKNDNHDDKCPMNNCRLMKPGCTDEAVSNNVRIAKVGDKFAMQAWLDPKYGYIENFCVSCTNGDKSYSRQTITYDNVKVHLPSKCTYDMTESPSAPVDPIVYSHDDNDIGD